MKKKGIYLDYAATTPIDSAVLKLMNDVCLSFYANPTSLHEPGRLAKKRIEEARTLVANILEVKSSEIIFPGSGTEADNLALFGIAHANKHFHFGKHIIISTIEHKAILESAERLKKEGFEISYAPVDKDGILDINKFKKLLREDTILVSIIYANNEIGTIQPMKEIAKIIKNFRSSHSGTNYPLFHTDACQAAGALNISIKELGVDLMTINGSKIYGPKGVGCLFIKKGIKIEPQIVGGGQEWGQRAGTESISLIIGLAEALKIAVGKQEKENVRLLKLRDYLIDKIEKNISYIFLNGHRTKRLPNNINFSFTGIEGEALVLYLDNAKIYCSTGSACSSLDLLPSHVLLSIGLTPELAHGSLRITLGRDTKMSDLDILVNQLVKIISNLRSISAIKINKNERK
ncbi:MAG: cysteine desulfurase family protein [Candidatus Zambryskibacteria bacterium]|nr:cysteine desulfurase family protein [Candidatus Zambryskibacteria bacterium]